MIPLTFLFLKTSKEVMQDWIFLPLLKKQPIIKSFSTKNFIDEWCKLAV